MNKYGNKRTVDTRTNTMYWEPLQVCKHVSGFLTNYSTTRLSTELSTTFYCTHPLYCNSIQLKPTPLINNVLPTSSPVFTRPYYTQGWKLILVKIILFLHNSIDFYQLFGLLLKLDDKLESDIFRFQEYRLRKTWLGFGKRWSMKKETNIKRVRELVVG